MSQDFHQALQLLGGIQRQYGPALQVWFLLFFRMFAFATTGPILNRKNLPVLFKISLCCLLTGTFAWCIPGVVTKMAGMPPGLYILQLIMNIVVGAFIGFIGDMILQAVYSAGNTLNNQMGLSSAMMLDPASNKQTMILETLFSYLTILIFLELGGFYWIMNALKRSLTVFPLEAIQQPFMQTIHVDYLVQLSGNVLLIGTILASPMIIVTLAMDIMLGVVNRTAQQMPVFQLSFALKPAVGVGIMMATLTAFMQGIAHYLIDYAKMF